MSSHPTISIIASIGNNRELGKDGKLAWRISDDLRRVKALTMGHPIIMGRKTFNSIGRPLPGRTNIVLTRTPIPIEGCLVYNSLEQALDTARTLDTNEVFIFGGAQIYQEALPFTERLYLTVIEAEDAQADVFFPSYETFFTNVVSEEAHTDEKSGLRYRYIILER